MPTHPFNIFYGDAELNILMTNRFRVFDINEKTSIQNFVSEQNLNFKKGLGFYQLRESETIKGNKEVVIIDFHTNELFDKEEARKLLGSSLSEKVSITVEHLAKYSIFVQSTSSNRNLVEGTKFLYEFDPKECKLIEEARNFLVDHIENVIINKHDPRSIQYHDSLPDFRDIPKLREEIENAFIEQAKAFPQELESHEDPWTLEINENTLSAQGRIIGLYTELDYGSNSTRVYIEID